jgi:tetratricopeptide (TPR) repeat protein
MLVIRCVAILLAAAALSASGAVSRAAEPAPGAGPVVMGINPCLIANRTGHGASCPEPPAPDGGDNLAKAEAYRQRALFFIKMQDLASAMAAIDKALALDPDWPEGHHLAARIAAALPDIARAEQEIEIALRLAPDDLDVRATKAAILAWRFPEEALLQFNLILDRSADHIYAHGQRAKLLLQFDRPDLAVRDLDFVLNVDRAATEYLPLRAEANLKRGRPLDAIADYNAALKLDPGRLWLMLGRAKAFAESGDEDAAIADYDTVLGPVGSDKRRPYAISGEDLSRSLTERAKVLVRVKRFADAVTDMMAALATGDRRSMLRIQVFLRQNGYPETPLDGRDSTALRTTLHACFGLNSCFQKISDVL